MWILGAQGLRVSSYMPEVIPPEAHLPKKGRGDIVGRCSGVIRRILVGSWSRLLCVFVPSTRESRRASGKAAHPIVVVEAFPFRVLRVMTWQEFERQWFYDSRPADECSGSQWMSDASSC